MFDLLFSQLGVILIFLGLFSGLMAGLLGVGGGLIIVPVLIIIFEQQNFPVVYLSQMAVATSLTTIIFTSMSSIRSHHQAQIIDWSVVFRLSTGIVVGAILGALFASKITGVLLQALFGIFAVLVSLQMVFSLKPKAGRALPGKLGLGISGSVIAAVSALFGIGGGSLSVPLLSWFGVEMKKAVAISSACGLPIAFFASAGFILAGWKITDFPAGTFAYIYWPAVLLISSVSMITAHYGARLAQRLPAQKLKQIFAVFLFIIGVRFIFRIL